MAKAHHGGLLVQAQDLNEDALKGIKLAAAAVKPSYAAVVWLVISGQHPESQELVAVPLDFAGGDPAHAVGVEQQHCQPLRERLRLHVHLPISGILGLSWDQDGREIQFIHQVEQKIHLVVF
jgi:hypothetical protein